MTHVSLYSVAVVDSQLYSTAGENCASLVYVVCISLFGGNCQDFTGPHIDRSDP